mgnify:CR=1 FL=1
MVSQLQSINKTSRSILLDLIYASLGARLLPDDITWGEPEAYEPYPDDDFKRDTRLQLIASDDAKYVKGRKSVTYRRLRLAQLESVSQNVVTSRGFPFSTYEVLDQLNLIYGVMLEEDDVYDIQYTHMAGPFVLRAKPGSLAWVGELEFAVEFTDLELPALVINRDMDGFTPDEVEALEAFKTAPEDVVVEGPTDLGPPGLAASGALSDDIQDDDDVPMIPGF